MSDSIADVYTATVTFSKEEMPTAAKFQGWATLINSAFDLLGKYIGDIHCNDDENTQKISPGNVAIAIPSLGRMLGPSTFLNPYQLSGWTRRITFSLADYASKKYAVLPHPVVSASILDFTGTGASTTFATKKATWALCTVAGDYFVDYANGLIFTVTAIPSGATVAYDAEYTTSVDPFTNGFTCMPDMWAITNNPSASQYCYLTGSAGSYTLYTPYGYSGDFLKGNYPDYDPEGLNYIGNIPASAGGAYRLPIPSYITNQAAGTTIPDGYFYLTDAGHGYQPIDGLTFKSTGNSYSLTIETADAQAIIDLDLKAYATAPTNGTSASQAKGFILVCSAAPATLQIGYLKRVLADHVHTKASGTTAVSHSDLTDLFPDANNWYVKSKTTGNDHPQYLLRTGWSNGSDPLNGDNALLGPLFMGISSLTAPADYSGLSAYSHPIYFSTINNYIRHRLGQGIEIEPKFISKAGGVEYLKIENRSGGITPCVEFEKSGGTQEAFIRNEILNDGASYGGVILWDKDKTLTHYPNLASAGRVIARGGLISGAKNDGTLGKQLLYNPTLETGLNYTVATQTIKYRVIRLLLGGNGSGNEGLFADNSNPYLHFQFTLPSVSATDPVSIVSFQTALEIIDDSEATQKKIVLIGNAIEANESMGFWTSIDSKSLLWWFKSCFPYRKATDNKDHWRIYIGATGQAQSFVRTKASLTELSLLFTIGYTDSFSNIAWNSSGVTIDNSPIVVDWD